VSLPTLHISQKHRPCPASDVWKRLILLMTLLGLGVGLFWQLEPATALAQEEVTNPAAEVRRLREQAKDLGAKGQLPMAWWDLDSRLKNAEKNGATELEWDALGRDATLLVNRATFVQQMRQQKSSIEATLNRFDQALREIATLYGLETDPELTASAAAAELLESLNRQNLRRQVTVDSLTVVNRRLNESVGGRAAEQDSLITALRVESSNLRRLLWETELRVGVAEADRSAAETILTRKQDREAAIAAVKTILGPEEGEILLTPDGDILLRVFGISFAVGSASLREGQAPLVDRVARAVGLFPGASVRVEGHTDDTGARDANLRLSRRRAETVARLLEGNLGQAEGSIVTDGYGPDRPIALNSTADGRALNRRIDVVIQTPD